LSAETDEAERDDRRAPCAGADAEPAGDIGVGIALAQVRHDQQGLPAGVQAPPPRSERGAVGSQRVGEHDQRRVDTIIPEG